MSKNIFKRVEKKYILSESVFSKLCDSLVGFMRTDAYGWQPIHNIYFDNCADEIIRRSMEKPLFKEKMRMRSYGTVTEDNNVFFELKKKYNSVVYKRRIEIPYNRAQIYLRNPDMPLEDYFAIQRGNASDAQIKKELDYFLNSHKVYPKIFIKYDRLGLVCMTDPNLRITFDTGLEYRQTNLMLDRQFPNEIFSNTKFFIMEIKTATAMPIWLCEILSDLKIFPTSFSKYGEIYNKILNPEEDHALCLKALLQTA